MQKESPWQEPREDEVDCYAIYKGLPEASTPFTVLHWRTGPGGNVSDDNAVGAYTLNGARKALHDTVERELFHFAPEDDDYPNLIEVWL